MPVALARCDAIGSAIERGTRRPGGEVDDGRGAGQQRVDQLRVEDRALDHGDLLVDTHEVGRGPRGEVVEHHDVGDQRGGLHPADEVRSDEAGPAGDDDAHPTDATSVRSRRGFQGPSLHSQRRSAADRGR